MGFVPVVQPLHMQGKEQVLETVREGLREDTCTHLVKVCR